MFVKLGISLLLSLFVLGSGCSSKSADDQNPAQANAPQTASTSPSNTPAVNTEAKPEPAVSPAPGRRFLDACALLEKSEIASVQGAEVRSTVPSTQMNGALAISQCYYSVTSADGSKNLSVHLEVILPDPKSPNAVRDHWERAFGEKAKGEAEKEEKEGGKPQPVPGLGEEAFWTGNIKALAVYALQRGKMVRVSVGGPGDVKTKIEKSRTLAKKVLARLK
jgi:hypothetical protein